MFIQEDTREPNTRPMFHSHSLFGVVQAVCERDGGLDGFPHKSIGMSTKKAIVIT